MEDIKEIHQKYLLKKSNNNKKPYELCKPNITEGGFHEFGGKYNFKGLVMFIEDFKPIFDYENKNMEIELMSHFYVKAIREDFVKEQDKKPTLLDIKSFNNSKYNYLNNK